jgi:hypothetical protein
MKGYEEEAETRLDWTQITWPKPEITLSLRERQSIESVLIERLEPCAIGLECV